MSITIEFVGGPVDGRIEAIPGDHPPRTFVFPSPSRPIDWLAPDPVSIHIVQHFYEPMPGAGTPHSVNGRGEIRYRYVGTDRDNPRSSEVTAQ